MASIRRLSAQVCRGDGPLSLLYDFQTGKEKNWTVADFCPFLNLSSLLGKSKSLRELVLCFIPQMHLDDPRTTSNAKLS